MVTVNKLLANEKCVESGGVATLKIGNKSRLFEMLFFGDEFSKNRTSTMGTYTSKLTGVHRNAPFWVKQILNIIGHQ